MTRLLLTALDEWLWGRLSLSSRITFRIMEHLEHEDPLRAARGR